MCRRARGLTLIEVLAVVAILVVVSAVAMPQIGARLGDARLDAAAGQLDATLIQARAESQRRGEALRVVARKLRDGTAIIFRPLVEATAEESGAADKPADPAPDIFALVDQGIEVTGRDPSKPDDDKAAEPEAEAPAEELLLATFLPDGSAIAAGRVFLVRARSAYSVGVNQWTGGASLSRMQLKAESDQEPVASEGAGGP